MTQNIIPKAVEPDGIRVQEVLVVQIVSNDYVGHGEQHCGIGTGSNRDPLLSERGCCFGVSRINADESGTALPCLLEAPGGVEHPPGGYGIPAPKEHKLGVPDIFIAVASIYRAIGCERGKVRTAG
jgi:hypothetical protein